MPSEQTTTRRPWRALIATSDKRDLVALARGLSSWEWEIFATSGCAAALRDAAIPVADAATLAAAPPLLAGRLKTLSMSVFGSLLMRPGVVQDDAEATNWGFAPIHMLVSAFYPIQPAEELRDVGQQWIEGIDIGGPAMLRAAAKNHQHVIPLINPDSYAEILGALAVSGGDPAGISLAVRRRLAHDVFCHTSRYDSVIAEAFARYGLED